MREGGCDRNDVVSKIKMHVKVYEPLFWPVIRINPTRSPTSVKDSLLEFHLQLFAVKHSIENKLVRKRRF